MESNSFLCCLYECERNIQSSVTSGVVCIDVLSVTDHSRAQSPPIIMGTPVKGAAAVPVTPEKSQAKSIYEQLGWDDEMEI